MATAEQTAQFERWVEGTADTLYRLAARVLGDLDGAEDVLQDAYLRAFAALRRGEFSGASDVRTWLYRIVLNVALNARRSQRRRGARLRAAVSEIGSGERMTARLRLRDGVTVPPASSRAAASPASSRAAASPASSRAAPSPASSRAESRDGVTVPLSPALR